MLKIRVAGEDGELVHEAEAPLAVFVEIHDAGGSLQFHIATLGRGAMTERRSGILVAWALSALASQALAADVLTPAAAAHARAICDLSQMNPHAPEQKAS